MTQQNRNRSFVLLPDDENKPDDDQHESKLNTNLCKSKESFSRLNLFKAIAIGIIVMVLLYLLNECIRSVRTAIK